jgi:hypothetical protein
MATSTTSQRPSLSASQLEPIKRRFGRIPHATQHAGIGRSSLYEIAAEHPGLFVKFKTATLVDLAKLDEILDALPPAKIKGTSKRPAAT